MWELQIINGTPIRVRELLPSPGITSWALEEPAPELYPCDALQEESARLNDQFKRGFMR